MKIFLHFNLNNMKTSTLIFLLTACLVEGRGPLIWQEEFNTLDTGRWKHLITGWRGGNNEFQYYDNFPENRYVIR